MSNKFSTIKERILYILEIKGIVKDKFFAKIGMTYGNFTGKAKLTPLNSDAVSNILLEIPDLSPDWLLLGKEPMLRSEHQPQTSEPTMVYERDPRDVELISTQKDLIASLKQRVRDLEQGHVLHTEGITGVPPADVPYTAFGAKLPLK